jgi:succinate dehydrogenase/fumarate reductase flavoprotein subunit
MTLKTKYENIEIKCLNMAHTNKTLVSTNNFNGEYVSFGTPNVILATGGPAGIYADSVFPECHHGSTGLAVDAGAKLQNMTEW